MPPPSKQKSILETATRLFMERGFRGVSMDMIAATTPVSKPTLYAHFKNKRDLFAAVIVNQCQQFLESLEDTVKNENDTRRALEAIGDKFLDKVLHKDSIFMHRVICAECKEFPEMATMLYESGPKQSLSFMTKHFQAIHKNGALKIEDPGQVAELFLSMMKGYLHLQMMLGIVTDIPAARRKKHVRAVVDMILQAYAV